jgi:hypothetical protein
MPDGQINAPDRGSHLVPANEPQSENATVGSFTVVLRRFSGVVIRIFVNSVNLQTTTTTK